jgi:histidinol-phosphatase (PHP family)
MHSNNSVDGADSIAEMCENAVETGLYEIAVTDHFEPESTNPGYKEYKPSVYWSELESARDKYRGRLKIKAGVELGQPHLFPNTSDLLVKSHPYDYVIGSAHKFPGDTDVGELDFSSIKLDDLYDMYLKQLKELIVWGNFDCIGHLDLIKRYSVGCYTSRITLAAHYQLLKQVLQLVISKGKGIEINTSSLRQSIKETMPGLDVLKIYRELGGEILTIGSDAHCAADVGKGIADAVEMVRDAGFIYITVYNNRLPAWRRIADKTGTYDR